MLKGRIMSVSNFLKSLFANLRYFVVTLTIYSMTSLLHAADIQPGQKIFCAFPVDTSGMNSYRLNFRKKSTAYLVNGKRKIALSLSGALDAHTLLWNIPAKAKLGNYTFKVLKKQNKKSKQYFTCGKSNDYRLTNTPSIVAITETTQGTLITNSAGTSQGSFVASGNGFTSITWQPSNEGLDFNGGAIALDNTWLNNPGDFTNYNGASLTQNGGFSAGVTITNYVPNDTGIHLNLDGNFIASGSFFVDRTRMDEKFDVILSGAHTGDLKLDAPSLSKCQASLKENYWDFATFVAQLSGSAPICFSYEEYKNYISKSVTDVVAACGLNISDNTNIIVNGLSMRATISSLQQMQADAALVSGCDNLPQ